MVPSTSQTVRQRRRPLPRVHPGQGRQIHRRNRQVEAHSHLVPPLASHYARCSGECRDDLLQVGLLGLIRAAELYNPGLGTPFAVFARPHIRGAILHHLRDTAPLVRLPRRLAELQERLRQARAMEASAQLPHPMQWLLERQHQLSHPLPLEDFHVQSLASALEEPLWEEPLPTPATLLEHLEEEQRQVVERVVLAGGSYRSVGRDLGISAMTVQRRLQRGLQVLRQQLDRTPGI